MTRSNLALAAFIVASISIFALGVYLFATSTDYGQQWRDDCATRNGQFVDSGRGGGDNLCIREGRIIEVYP